MGNGIKLAVSLVFLALPIAGQANQLRQIPFDQRVKLAEIVVIARTISSFEKTVGNNSLRESKMIVADYLKGSGADTLVVRDYLINIAEADSRCCDVGKTYVLILSRNRDGSFTPVNGPYGAYGIETR